MQGLEVCTTEEVEELPVGNVYGKPRISTPLTYHLVWIVWIMYNTLTEPRPSTHLCWIHIQGHVLKEAVFRYHQVHGKWHMVHGTMAHRADGGVTRHQLSSFHIAQLRSMAASRGVQAALSQPLLHLPLGDCNRHFLTVTRGTAPRSHHHSGFSLRSFTHLPLCF